MEGKSVSELKIEIGFLNKSLKTLKTTSTKINQKYNKQT